MKTMALIGPSGTGKSHRALMVAHDYHADLIIDDGLLIQESRIVAGTSAKKQDTVVGAIKTALFSDPNHAQEVKDQIERLKAERVLILGTSLAMVKRIANNLNLPLPEDIIEINQIATEKEIQQAKSIRQKYGKHVIPAPTVEVKPKLSGTLMDPIRTFYTRRHHSRDLGKKRLWVEQTVVRPTFNYLGKFYIANNVLQDIVIHCTKGIPGLQKISRVEVENTNTGIILNVDLTVHYGYHLLSLAQKVQATIITNVEYMTALHVLAANIHLKKMIVLNPMK